MPVFSESVIQPLSADNVVDMDLAGIQQNGLKRFWLALPSYAAVLALLWIGVTLGTVKPSVAWVLTGVSCLALSSIYVALRLGAALRTPDPMLAFAHASFSIALVAIGYALLDNLRSTALLWLSVIVVFDMWRLPPKQVRLAMALCVVLPLLATVSRYSWHPEPLNWVHELFTLSILAVVLPVLYAVSAQARAVRARHLAQKQQMSDTLARLHQLSILDALTGAYNRRHMLALLDEEMRRWHRHGKPFSVAILDLDLFKRVNDQHGHATGDAVLQAFSRLAQAAFPASADMFGRWGGEEFVLLQSETRQGDAVAALHRLREACHAHDWSQYAKGLAVTFSAGVCQQQADHTLMQTLDAADQALYKAKAEGRDRILAHGPLVTPIAPIGPPVRPCAPVSAEAAHVVYKGLAEALPDDDASSSHVAAHPGWQHRVLAFIFGRNARLRPYQYMCMLGVCVYLTSIAGFMLYVIPSGLLTLQQGWFFIAHNILAAVVPFTLLRLGITARWRDPSFVLPQILWGGTGVIIGYGMMPSTSPSTLQMICLSLVFGFSSLRPREALLVGKYDIALMLGVLAARALLVPDTFNARRETLEVAMTCMALWILTLQSHKLSVNRERVREEKRELAKATERVNQIMMRDPLTGLFNRQYMQVLLERECTRHQRSGTSFSVALIDLDHFKAINDGHGHAVGDQVLAGFAKEAQLHLRDTDVLCRWGGEEFFVLLVGADPGANGLLAMGRLQAALAGRQLSQTDADLRVTFSAGVAERLRDEPIVRTLQRADEALYAAKAAGRDRCILARPAQPPQERALA